ncbi:ATP-binding protein [Paenibacillus silviterrae]|uniref:ATP-binding protein n=1 Tax=Paenibacillus silviterrae TaxID=3242194 RepID=UPI002543F85D|nr:ATP-binding protein [Paenibacillus chinjuensis]
MAFEKGGRADKLGNRYEGLWVANKMLDILDGTIRSIVVEAVGEDEQGAELWLELFGGTRQAHQCKARNGSKEYWSVSDLGNAGVLGNLQKQLDRSGNHEFVFVSGVPVTKLGDICDSARNSNGDPEIFYKFQIIGTGKPRTKVFQDFCSMLSLDYTNETHRARAFSYLLRTRIVLFPFHDSDIHTRIRYTLTGEAKSVLKLLANYAEDNECFGQNVYQDMLIEYLEKKDILAKNLSTNMKVWPKIADLVSEFKESIQPLFVRDCLIKRNETEQCLSMLDNKGFIILHGDAGYGKSGVLYELTEKLQERNIPVFAVRIDKRIPENTTRHFGNEMGLPDSPVFCLSAVSGVRSSVVIIDQLDSIRWTSIHSSNALEVCKELVNEVSALRRNGHDIKIVISCRTFDLHHDPEIRHWLQRKDTTGNDIWGKVEVTSIDYNAVKSIVGSFYEHLTEKQINLLSNLQNLYLWCRLSEEGYSNNFSNTYDLLRSFWEFIYQKIERIGIGSTEIKDILSKLADFMSSSGKNSAPSRLLLGLSQSAVQALKSNSVIQEEASRISFCHQSYLDYLVATKIVEEMDMGKDIFHWVGSKENQTLFRRDQLKQAVNILLQEQTQNVIHIISKILDSLEVRFHLKHLVLEVITSMAHEDILIDELLIELVQEDKWRYYILDLSFNQPEVIDLFVNSSFINEWITTSSDRQKNAFLLLRYAKDVRPDVVAELLEPHLYKGEEWEKYIANVMGFDIATDSDRLFAFRLKLAEKQIFPYIIKWESICISHPNRALDLINEMMKLHRLDAIQKLRIEKWHDHDMRSLKKMAEEHSELTWDYLLRYINEFTDNDYDHYKLTKWERRKNEYDVINGIIKILIYAGQSMSQTKPNLFIEKISSLANCQSFIVQLILIKCLSNLPKEYSDFGIQWLINRSYLMEAERRFDNIMFKNVGILIERLSPNCSQLMLAKLESWIINYHEPDELEKAKNYLKHRKNGLYYHYWGYAQYVLLSKVQPSLLSKSGREMIRCLRRKFDDVSPNQLLNETQTRGGSIGSKLDRNLYKIKNKSWIKIVSTKTLPVERGGFNWKRIDDDNWVESSVWQFSRSLATAAKLEPERFGQLALSFPKDIHPSYIVAILDSFQLQEPESSIPEELRETWTAASFSTILAFIEHFKLTEDAQTAKALCWLFVERKREPWPKELITKLVYIAKNQSDLEIGKLNVHKSDWDHDMTTVSLDDLYTNTINCVKGVAAKAIGSILWHQQSLFKEVCPAIRSLINDPHPVVRMSSIAALLPTLNIDREWAIDNFFIVAQSDLRSVCSREATHFISYTILSYKSMYKELFRKMINSDNVEVASHGAKLVTSSFIFHQLFEDLVRECSSSHIYLKKSVASTASEYISDSYASDVCRQLLTEFIESEDCEELSDEISSMFRSNILEVPGNRELVNRYLLSNAFNDRSLFIHHLEEYEGDLLFFSDVIFNLFEAFINNKDRTSYRFDYWLEDAITLLLRLYDRAKDNNHDVFSRCLDTWDVLFESRITSAQKIVKVI